MRILDTEEAKTAASFLEQAAEQARHSTCQHVRCGAVIVKGNEVIGRGFNSPPKELESQRRCNISKESYNKKITDKTCCVHAEQRAIIDALKNSPGKINGSALYFMRVNGDGNITTAGKPYCTICSKMALDVGISEFVLWHNSGITVYNTEEYNGISFDYKE